MKVLFIGGTGNISRAASLAVLNKNQELFLLNRGKRDVSIPGAINITCDINDEKQVRQKTRDIYFDCVVNWINFTVEDVQRDFRLFEGKTRQYIFISSASVYKKPPDYPLIDEKTQLFNPFWEYAQNKIQCENWLMKAFKDKGFPVTIVRPSLTFDTVLPTAIGSKGGFTVVNRMLSGKKIIAHGDGTSLWVCTHSEDFAKGFAGLTGNHNTIGESFHITSDEILTWNQIYNQMAEAACVKADIIHIPTDFIQRIHPAFGPGLVGDKAHSVIFDNTKIKKYVPEFKANLSFVEGIKKTIAWFNEKDERRISDVTIDHAMDKVIAAYEGL